MASPSGISFKGIGLIAAGVLTLVFISIIVISAIFAGPTPQSQPNLFPDDEEIIDIEDTQSGGAMLVTIVDKDDPTRVASTLRADRFEPIGEGRRRLDKPESWIYLDDGRAIRVNANYATMLMPDPNQAPESGTLEGDIVVRAYDSTPAPGTPAPEDQPPSLTARFEQPVEFERRYLRMRSPGRFQIESSSVDFSGSDLTVILNDLRNRIELIDVEHGEQMVIHTDAVRDRQAQSTSAGNDQVSSQVPSTPATPDEQAQPDRTASAADPNTESPESAANPTAPTAQDQPPAQSVPDIQRYAVTLDRDVSASIAGSGAVNADTLELWAAFVDGRLPEDALRRISLAQSERAEPTPMPNTDGETDQGSDEPGKPAISAGATPEQPGTTRPQQQPNTNPVQPGGNDLVITWSGPMRVRPIDNEIPKQLENDALALRLGSDEGSGITMTGSGQDRGFTGQAKQLTYYATRARAHLTSQETQAGIIKLTAEDGGTLFATDLVADLATGLISMNGRGSMTTAETDQPEDAASVRWTNNARIRFAINDRGELTRRLQQARFEGAAIAQQQGNSIGARVIDATLDPSRPPIAALTNLNLTDGVISSADNNNLSGRELTIDFAHEGAEDEPPYPVRVSSVGSALGRTPDAMLRAEQMHAQLFRDSSGETRLRAAQASGNVSYRDSKRTTANAEQLDANALDEVIVLTGPGSRVTQAGSAIAGEHITMRAKRRSVEVKGPGTFDHDIALADDEHATPGQLGLINARWEQSMRFEDTLGTIECNGSVRVLSTPDALTRDTLKAEQITINLTPMPSSDPVAGGGGRQRELLSARASGRAIPGQAPQPASIESRSYAPDDPELALGVLYLEGAQILADNQQQTLTVPGAGTLLILDRQRDENDQAQTDRSLDGSGLTRFNWASRMQLQRTQGTGTFAGAVRVDHKSLSSEKVATLHTDTLVARFEPEQQITQDAPASASESFTLRSATATGNVRFLYEGREMICGEALYDAVADSLFARTLDNSLVTLYDNTQTTPFSARTMRWDLSRDRVEFNAPSPVRTTPGG